MSDTKVLTLDGTQHLIDKIKSEKESTFRYTTMPTASVDNLGQVVQYVGETTSVAPIYTNGYFYKCVAQGTDPETYAWEAQPVQEGGGSGISSDSITEIEVEISPTTFKPTNVYVMYEDGFEIKPFATATDMEIDETLKRYYAGRLSLSDIQQVWSIGDTRDMYVDTIPYEQPLMPGQMGDVTLQMMIVDFNKNTLETPTSERTKALLCLHSKYNFGNISMDDRATTSSGYGWENLKLRAWLNDNFKNAMPSAMVSRIKSVQRTFGSTTLYDEIYVLSREEAYGGYSYYDSDAKRIKTGSGGGTVMWWLCNESGNPSAGTGLIYPQVITQQGQQGWSSGYTGRQNCIPAFCI